MATLIKHKSGIFHIVYSNQGKRIWRSLGTRDRHLAYFKFIQCEKNGLPQGNSSAREQEQTRSTSDHLTLQNAVDEYLSYVKANFSVNTYRAYKSITNLVLNFFGPTKSVMEITVRDIERYKSVKAIREISPHTVNYDLRCMRAFFHLLVHWGLLEKSPCDEVKPIRIDDAIRPYLSREELVAVLTGLRLGEIVNLTWEDIILEKRKIVVRSSSTFRTKNGKLRVLPINTELHKLLAQIQDKTRILFKGKDGQPLRAEFVSKQFKKAVIRCKLNPKLHFHSLRHTFGSYLVEQGVSLFHVQQLMGHSSPFVTQIYAHLGTAELLESVEKIGVSV